MTKTKTLPLPSLMEKESINITLTPEEFNILCPLLYSAITKTKKNNLMKDSQKYDRIEKLEMMYFKLQLKVPKGNIWIK